MRKKFLAALLALVMVIGLLPITALAAELTEAQKKALKDAGYTDEEIANVMVIDEDTEISEDFDGLVVVVGSVSVTVKGANIGVGLVVAPGASDAKIVLGENAVVNAVIGLEKANITVSETAQVTNLTVAAADTVVKVDGTVSNLGAASTAEKVSITVSEKATVSSLTVAAPNAKADIAGTVTSVSVEETAVGADLTVSETGTVAAATVSAPDVAMTVNGTVTTVEVSETATGLQVAGDKADSVEMTGATDNVTTSTEKGTVEVGVGGTVETGTSNHISNPGIKAAPLGDKSNNNVVYAPGYTVKVQENDSNDKMLDVTIVGKIPQHMTSDSTVTPNTQGFVGIAIPLPTKTLANGDVQKTVDYNYYVIVTTTTVQLDKNGKPVGDPVTETEITVGSKLVDNSDVSGREMQAQGITDANLNALYDTIYFLDATVAKMSAKGYTSDIPAETDEGPGDDDDDAEDEAPVAVKENVKVKFEIIAIDAEKDPANTYTANDKDKKDAAAGEVSSVACEATRTAKLDAVAKAAVDAAIKAGTIKEVSAPADGETATKEYTDYKAAVTAIENAAKKQYLENIADMILNIKTDLTETKTEYIKVTEEEDADPVYSKMDAAPSQASDFNNGKIITAPEGTFVDKKDNVPVYDKDGNQKTGEDGKPVTTTIPATVKDDAAAAASDATFSKTPTYYDIDGETVIESGTPAQSTKN